MHVHSRFWFCLAALGAAVTLHAQENMAARDPSHLLWGDTHVHSSYSMDAGLMGNLRLGPDAAYRFARGEEIVTNGGSRARLKRPLDFLVVADHAEYMGLLPRVRAGDPVLLADAAGQRIAQGLKESARGKPSQMAVDLIESLARNQPVIDNGTFKSDVWLEITRIADSHNDPGVFSALIGFEWSSMPGGDNLHRVVMYRDGADKASRLVPVSAFDSERPEDLWSFLERYVRTTQGDVLAIPHNGNLSNGRMFVPTDSEGEPIDRAYAARRAHWEPVVEVTQIKGDAETHPLLSPDDEFADFETWDKGNLDVAASVPKVPWMLQYEYARSALKLGLDVEARVDENPFRFGLIGSTDAHTSMATADEDNFWGKAPLGEKGMDRISPVFLASSKDASHNIMAWQQVASGYAAVWATGNTRAEIFDAFRRREVYATTGPRIALRFFAGDYAADDIHRPNRVDIGYRRGVPMGGAISSRDGSPAFLVMAARDPEGANLDRLQIVKGWRDTGGVLREKVYTVALSDEARRRKDGSITPVGSTIGQSGTSWLNRIGSPELSAYWRDPDFDPFLRCFYYVRAIEIPTPRWTAYDAQEQDIALEEIPAVVQDRAYSSPIWYSPRP